jgi:hypothetical protein
MKRKNPFYYTLLLLLPVISIACKKGDAGSQPLQPVATDIGAPDGTAISKNIGSAGGSIVSADGMLELVIPAGALSANTNITIQPITNKVPGGVGKGYRCLPDGQQFAKDVTLKIRYTADDLAATDVNCMGIAFQNSDRYWQVVNGFTNDSAAKVIAVPVNHFTDYTIFHLFSIEPAERFLKLNQAGTFKIEVDGSLVSTSEQVQFIALAQDLEDRPVVWKANGVANGNAEQGRITGDYPTATYTAPAARPARNPVSISATINLPFTLSGQHFNQVILTASAFIRLNNYKFSLRYEWAAPDACSYNGQNEFDAADMQVAVVDTVVTFSHFANQQPLAINPASISFGNCSINATAGTTGFINITSGTGKVEKELNGESRLRLDLKNSGATSNTCSVVCPGMGTQTSNSQVISDHTISVYFALKDSLQTQGSKPGIFFQLKPIP